MRLPSGLIRPRAGSTPEWTMASDAPPYGCLSVLALPFLLGGAAMTFVALDSLGLHARSAGWPTVPATIEHVELEKRGSKSNELVVTYAY